MNIIEEGKIKKLLSAISVSGKKLTFFLGHSKSSILKVSNLP